MAAILSTTSLYSPPLPSCSSSSSTLQSPLNLIRFPIYHSHQPNCRTANANHRHVSLLFTCRASSNHDNHNYESEEQRWLREEKRWLREEQRWLREEARWNAERQSLLLQIQRLQSELDRVRVRYPANFDVDFVLEDSSASETLTKMAALLKGTVDSKSNVIHGDSKQIADISVKLEVDKPVNGESVVPPESTPEEVIKEVKTEVKRKKISSSSNLRMGAEGEEVRALQEALMSLGFYSGEEDMEYSSFSDGTASAVKTWQASIGIREDGIVTEELLERLYASVQVQTSESSVNADIKKIVEANGAVIELREDQQTIVKKGPADVDMFENRVFLLGENRWEDPSRLNRGNGEHAAGQVSTTKCPTCRGEGRLMCMECDGSGEPNVDEQFMEWMEDEAKCPYCEGQGYTVCDVCQGKPVLL